MVMQTLRRLAQNREAAKKSRLRKKVNLFILLVYIINKLNFLALQF